jgi:hypothetical protein
MFQAPSSYSQPLTPSTQPPSSYTPPHLADRIRAATIADGERKTITALFADLKGSTALIEGLDPEEARAIIDPALQLMMDAVHRYEGYVAQALGDAKLNDALTIVDETGERMWEVELYHLKGALTLRKLPVSSTPNPSNSAPRSASLASGNSRAREPKHTACYPTSTTGSPKGLI